MLAWKDTKAYIVGALPDTRHMLGVIGWYVLLTVVIRGPELGEDLRELDVSACRCVETGRMRVAWRLLN